MAKRQRADVLLVELGLAPTRSRAQAMILAGDVLTENEQRVDKPGQLLDAAQLLRIRGQSLKFVSRGGLKLDAALERFGVQVEGQVCLDVGASTGGFTDCLLQRGAAKVYAVDVGYGQLAWQIRQDPRVIVLERTNVRHLTSEQVPEACSRIVIDVSFISLRLVLPSALIVAARDAEFICLVKPQFEVGRDRVGKGGVVRDALARQDALDSIVEECKTLGLRDIQTMDSPIEGAKGNREFLLAAKR